MAVLTATKPTTVIEHGFDEFETGDMTVDPADLAYLVSLLSNLYTDPEYAVLRELVANGIDSHRQNGNPETPVEVTLPSIYSPYLVITDHGIGMSRDDLRKVFLSPLKSTKRGDDGTIGAFGIGSKSPYSVAGTYTMETVKDGRKVLIEYSKTDDQTPDFTILHEADTDAPSGVKITVPVAPSNRWYRAAERLFSTWLAGPVMVDGTLHDKKMADPDSGFTHLSGPVWHHESDKTMLHVVLGGIVYPAPGIEAPQGLYLVLDPGKVDLTPSRDTVMVNQRTRRVLDKVLDTARDEATSLVESAKSQTDTTERLRRLTEAFRNPLVRVFFDTGQRRRLVTKIVNEAYGVKGDNDNFDLRVTVKTLHNDKVKTTYEPVGRMVATTVLGDDRPLIVCGDADHTPSAVATNASRILRLSERPESSVVIFPTVDHGGLRLDQVGLSPLRAAECVEEGKALFRAHRAASGGGPRGTYRYDVTVYVDGECDTDTPHDMDAAELRDEAANGSLLTRGGGYNSATDACEVSSLRNTRVVLISMGRAQVHTLHKRIEQTTTKVHDELRHAHHDRFLALSQAETEDALVARTVQSWARQSARHLFGFLRSAPNQTVIDCHRMVAERGARTHGDSVLGRSFARYIEWIADPKAVEAELDSAHNADDMLTSGSVGTLVGRLSALWDVLPETVDQQSLDALLAKAVADWTASEIADPEK